MWYEQLHDFEFPAKLANLAHPSAHDSDVGGSFQLSLVQFSWSWPGGGSRQGSWCGQPPSPYGLGSDDSAWASGQTGAALWSAVSFHVWEACQHLVLLGFASWILIPCHSWLGGAGSKNGAWYSGHHIVSFSLCSVISAGNCVTPIKNPVASSKGSFSF